MLSLELSMAHEEHMQQRYGCGNRPSLLQHDVLRRVEGVALRNEDQQRGARDLAQHEKDAGNSLARGLAGAMRFEGQKVHKLQRQGCPLEKRRPRQHPDHGVYGATTPPELTATHEEPKQEDRQAEDGDASRPRHVPQLDAQLRAVKLLHLQLVLHRQSGVVLCPQAPAPRKGKVPNVRPHGLNKQAADPRAPLSRGGAQQVRLPGNERPPARLQRPDPAPLLVEEDLQV
mmetsp:Transcript_128066/g.370649  ORF Transcript_128066/g.370649 Transcript_128066/m.370649 type:complete len:230 (+) Transcript_128066:602-1291(+)